MAAAGPDLTGQMAPLYIITDDDKRGSIVMATAIGLSYVVLTLMIRAYIQLSLNQSTWLRDDWVTSIATVMSIIQSILVFCSVSKGFGLSDTMFAGNDVDINAAIRILYASDFLYLITLFISKAAYALLFLRIAFGLRSFLITVWGMVAASGVWLLISIILISAGCNGGYHQFADTSISCSRPYLRWQIITGLDIATEILLVLLSVLLVYSLQTSFRRKTSVVFAFSCRLITIVFAALRLHYVWNAVYSPDPSVAGADVVIWTQVEMAYSIMACTLPCIQPYLTATNTSWGLTNVTATGAGYGYANGNATNLMSNFSRPGNGSVSKPDERDVESGRDLADAGAGPNGHLTESANGQAVPASRLDESLLRGDTFKHATSVSHDNRFDRQSVGSDDSRKMIIKKEVQWMVEHGSKGGEANLAGPAKEPEDEVVR